MKREAKTPGNLFTATLRILAAVAVGGLPNIAAPQDTGESAYVKHRADPVQHIYSKALVGFALNQKCRFLPDSGAADYEQRLEQAGLIFQGYVVATKFVAGLEQAVRYTREMMVGSAKFAAASDCSTTNQEAVQSGYLTAQQFLPLLRELFEAPVRKP